MWGNAMTVIKVEAHLSSGDLLKAVEQLDAPQLAQFVAEVIALQARRNAPALPQAEAELLQRINGGVPADLQRRYSELIARQRAEQLTHEEHQELLRLTAQIERIEAQRVEDLAALARLRGASLAQLTSDLGIAPAARHD